MKNSIKKWDEIKVLKKEEEMRLNNNQPTKKTKINKWKNYKTFDGTLCIHTSFHSSNCIYSVYRHRQYNKITCQLLSTIWILNT